MLFLIWTLILDLMFKRYLNKKSTFLKALKGVVENQFGSIAKLERQLSRMYLKLSKMKLLKRFENPKFKSKKKNNQQQKLLQLKVLILLTSHKIMA